MADEKPLDLSPSLDPWERQPGETIRRHAQFTTYRDMGRGRTLRKAAETLTLNDRYVRDVAAANHWAARAEAWDRWRDKLHQDAWLDERRKVAQDDAKLLSGLVGKVAQRLQTLQPAEMDANDVIRMADVVLRHRRALFPIPLPVEVTGPGGDPITVQLAELAGMTDQQRREAVVGLAGDVIRRARAIAGGDDDE